MPNILEKIKNFFSGEDVYLYIPKWNTKKEESKVEPQQESIAEQRPEEQKQ